MALVYAGRMQGSYLDKDPDLDMGHRIPLDTGPLDFLWSLEPGTWNLGSGMSGKPGIPGRKNHGPASVSYTTDRDLSHRDIHVALHKLVPLPEARSSSRLPIWGAISLPQFWELVLGFPEVVPAFNCLRSSSLL